MMSGGESYDGTYVTDGLVAHFDGINNTGDGHDSSYAGWKDLTGNGYDLVLSGEVTELGRNLSWLDNALKINILYEDEGMVMQRLVGESRFTPYDDLTLEICYKVTYVYETEEGYVACAYAGALGNPNEETEKTVIEIGHGCYSRRSSVIPNIGVGDRTVNPFTALQIPDIRTMQHATVSCILPYPYPDTDNNIVVSVNGSLHGGFPLYGSAPSFLPHDMQISIPNLNYYDTPGPYTANVYSYRLYNRRLSKNEMRRNLYADRVRFGF